MLRYLLDTNQHRRLCVEAATCRGAFHLQRQRQPHGHFGHHPRRALARRGEKQPREREPGTAIEDFCSRLEILPYGPKAA